MKVELTRRLGALIRRQHGASTVEFAFLTPVMLVLMLMGFDAGRYVLATERIQEIANSVAEMLSQTNAAVSPTVTAHAGDGVVQDSDLHYYSDSAMATYPDVLAVANNTGTYWWQLLTVQMTSIKFTPTNCTTSCKPTVMWTTGARSCASNITAVPDTSPYSPTTLPTDVYGPGSILVVDVFYTFTPTFASAYMPAISIERSAYMAPRNVPYVESQASNMAPACAGVTVP